MNRQIQELMSESKQFESEADVTKKKEESRIQKDNQKIIEL